MPETVKTVDPLGMLEDELALSEGEVALWTLRLDALTVSTVARLSVHLSDAEWERNKAYGPEPLRRRDAACRGVLRGLLSRYIGVPAGALSLVRGAHGKPLLASVDVGVHFNYSHSGNLALFAVTRAGEVGVDVEDCSRKVNALGIARSYFTQMEYCALKTLSDERRMSEFLRYWTLKEAWLKARGEGIFAGLDRFAITLPAADEGEAKVRLASYDEVDTACEYSHTGMAIPGYRFGLVVRDVVGSLTLSQRALQMPQR